MMQTCRCGLAVGADIILGHLETHNDVTQEEGLWNLHGNLSLFESE